MKKISFFVAIAAAASLASCTAQAPKANMKNDVDQHARSGYVYEPTTGR